jgi:hypothetical protein
MKTYKCEPETSANADGYGIMAGFLTFGWSGRFSGKNDWPFGAAQQSHNQPE